MGAGAAPLDCVSCVFVDWAVGIRAVAVGLLAACEALSFFIGTGSSSSAFDPQQFKKAKRPLDLELGGAAGEGSVWLSFLCSIVAGSGRVRDFELVALPFRLLPASPVSVEFDCVFRAWLRSLTVLPDRGVEVGDGSDPLFLNEEREAICKRPRDFFLGLSARGPVESCGPA
jgi:hypothetical protein